MIGLDVADWKYVGVDGCPYGWFAMGFTDAGNCGFAKFKKFGELLKKLDGAKLVLVDMPIGLPEGCERRECDRLAKSKLGQRHSCVFYAPARKTVEYVGNASTPGYKCASEIERKATGHGMSIQAFNIAAKIDAVNKEIYECHKEEKPCTREVHPEICFWALNGKSAMVNRKDRVIGRKERLDVLQRALEKTGSDPYAIFKEARDSFPGIKNSKVGSDDIVDAMVAAVTAYLSKGDKSSLKTLPKNPPTDCKRLPMEMVYWTPESEKEQH